MCKCASFVYSNLTKKVYWSKTSDSHEEIISEFKLKEEDRKEHGEIQIIRVEISPENNNLSLPLERWKYQLDEKNPPNWYDEKMVEFECRQELKNWKKEKLTGWNVQEAFNPIHPFKIEAKKLNEKHIEALKNWASVGDSVWNSVWNSNRNSVCDSVCDSVRNSVWDSVGDSVCDSVGDSVWDSIWNSIRNSVGDSARNSARNSVWNSVWNSVYGYIGSLFEGKITKWKYIENIEKPWESISYLWHEGYVPIFDGKTWRLHAGKDAEIVYEWTPEIIS